MLGVQPGLLRGEHRFVHACHELLARLAHNHVRYPLEAMPAEFLQVGPAVFGDQVLLDLHEDVVSRQQRRHRACDAGHAPVVHALDAEAELGLVVRVRQTPPGRLPETALRGPLLNLAVAELCVLRVLLQEAVHEIKGGLVWDRHGEHHGALVLRQNLRQLSVRLRRVLDGAACERKCLQGRRAEVHLNAHAAERHVGKEGLVLEFFWQGLRLTDALTVPEQADSVRVRALGVEVQQHTDDLALREPLRCHELLTVRHEEALRVEADAAAAVRHVPEHQRGARRGEADPHRLLGLRRPSCVAGLVPPKGLQHLDLEHVPALLHPHARAGASHEELRPPVGQPHEDTAPGGGHHVESAVVRREGDLVREPLPLVVGRALLQLGGVLLH
mmetsp:Transcript_54869/g.153017  ORF Transcript_54869/g.153017 Transcript_54869/m.153017 type:complete len:387 (+) Transcript_54869:1300-2460(+)